MKLKNILLIVFAAIFFLFPMSASARDKVFVDDAKLVKSSSDSKKIDKAVWETSVKHGVDIWIHTTKSTKNQKIYTYADEWYQENHTTNNGIILVVCSTTNEYYILTSGKCIQVFTDSKLDTIESAVVPKMSKGNYKDAFLTFADYCDDYLLQYDSEAPVKTPKKPKDPFNWFMALLISLGAGLVGGGGRVFLQFTNMKSVHLQRAATDYKKPDSFKLVTNRDLYLYKKVERREKEQNQNSSSGASTTRTGSSGQSRGGSGGRF